MGLPLVTDPYDWKLDEDGDVIVPIEYVRGLEAVEQACRVNIRAVRGEWFANLDDGMPWYENDTVPERLALLGGRFNKARVLEEFRKVLLGSFGVSEVLSLDVTFDNPSRHMTVTWKTKTVWGDTLDDSLDEEI